MSRATLARVGLTVRQAMGLSVDRRESNLTNKPISEIMAQGVALGHNCRRNMKETARMNVFVPAALFAIAVALGGIGPARAAQEFSCTGPDTVTGKAIGPTTLSVPGFECAGAPQPYNALGDRAVGQGASNQTARRAPFVVVNFKAPPPTIKTGDTVTLKGHFSVVLDPAQQMDYVVVDAAEIAN